MPDEGRARSRQRSLVGIMRLNSGNHEQPSSAVINSGHHRRSSSMAIISSHHQQPSSVAIISGHQWPSVAVTYSPIRRPPPSHKGKVGSTPSLACAATPTPSRAIAAIAATER